MSKSQMKAVLITCFYITGIIHFELIPQGQTFNQAYYVEITEAVYRGRPELLSDWILYHDSASVHKVLSVKWFLAHILITEMDPPLCIFP
jgi:hypothetical protein